MDRNISAQLNEILIHYDLGELVDYSRDKRGTVNTSFAIRTRSEHAERSFFLRRYKAAIQEYEIQFEHSLIEHLSKKKSPPVAGVYRTRDGNTYIRLSTLNSESAPAYHAIFDYIAGDDRYTWINPHCIDAEVRSSARVLAQFHCSVEDLIPIGKRVEPAILELLPIVAETIQTCPNKSRHSVFDDYLFKHMNILLEQIDHTLTTLTEPASLQMPRLVIHCDYHPGNLKFQGSQVCGVFDFDWSKLDYRCFDVALGLYYFFTDWERGQNGGLRLPDVGLFLKSYQDELKKRSQTGPLSDIELHYLPAMIEASNLYVLNWTILDFYSKIVDPEEYLTYVAHAVENAKWFSRADNREKLRQAIQSIPG
jgi:homoserine kinase type II